MGAKLDLEENLTPGSKNKGEGVESLELESPFPGTLAPSNGSWMDATGWACHWVSLPSGICFSVPVRSPMRHMNCLTQQVGLDRRNATLCWRDSHLFQVGLTSLWNRSYW